MAEDIAKDPDIAQQGDAAQAEDITEVIEEDVAVTAPKIEPETGLRAYNNYQSPLVYIVPLTFALALGAGCLFTGKWPWHMACEILSEAWTKSRFSDWPYDRHLFMLYCCGFLAMWTVYFLSRKPFKGKISQDPRWKKVRTLRRLLGETSKQWDLTGSSANLAEIEAAYREKAKSSGTTLAIMLAVAGLELQRLTSIMDPILSLNTPLGFSWANALLLMSLLLALVAFVSVIISADALDVIFNNFKGDDDGHRVIRHYYSSTINPRYVALLSLIASFVLLVAYYSPTVATMALGILFWIGYPHWFPEFSTPESRTVRFVRFLNPVILFSPFVPVIMAYWG